HVLVADPVPYQLQLVLPPRDQSGLLLQSVAQQGSVAIEAFQHHGAAARAAQTGDLIIGILEFNFQLPQPELGILQLLLCGAQVHSQVVKFDPADILQSCEAVAEFLHDQSPGTDACKSVLKL